MAVGLKETVLAPRFSRVMCVLVVAVCATVLGSLVAYGRIEVLLRAAPAALLVAALTIVTFWLPRVRVGPAEIEVANPFRTWTLTWPAIVDVDTKWTLTLVTARRRVPVWAAPSPGPFGNIGSVRRDVGGLSMQRGASTPSAVGDVAAMLVLRQWQDYRDRGLLGEPEGEGVRVRANVPSITVCSALGVLTLAGILWP